MHIHTIEENFDYQMSRLIQKFKERFELEDITGEEFQEKVWSDKNLASEFGRACLEVVNNFDEDIFETDYKA